MNLRMWLSVLQIEVFPSSGLWNQSLRIWHHILSRLPLFRIRCAGLCVTDETGLARGGRGGLAQASLLQRRGREGAGYGRLASRAV